MATTLSLVVIFLPVAFMTGYARRFIYPFGWTMAFAILVSMVVSFTLTPMLSSRFLKLARRRGRGTRPRTAGSSTSMDRVYTASLRWTLAHPMAIIGISAAPAGADGSAEPDGRAHLRAERGHGRVHGARRHAAGHLARGHDRDRAEHGQGDQRAGRRVARRLPGRRRPLHPLPRLLLSAAGRRADGHAGSGGRRGCARSWRGTRPTTRRYRRATRSAAAVATAHIQAACSAPTSPSCTTTRSRLLAKAQATPSLVDTRTDYSNASPEVQVAVDRARAADLGVRMATVGSTLRLMVAGDDEISTYREAGEQYPVKIRVLESQRRDIETVGKLTVPSLTGQPVRIDNIAQMVRGFGPTRITRLEPAVFDQLQRRRRAGPRARRGVERRAPADRRSAHAAGIHRPDAGADQQPRRDDRQPDHGDRARQHLRLHGAGGAVRELRAAAHHHGGAAAVGAVRAVHHLGDRADAESVERARHPAAVRHRQEELDSAGRLHQRPAGAGRAAGAGDRTKRAARGCGRF